MANGRLGLRTRPGLIRGYTEGSAGGDADASAFITAAGITDATIITAIQQLVIDFKAYGIWTKMKAIYPFVGGTASTHKWNLKDARDLDAAYRLTFYGGWTHDTNGITGNGSTGYADTFLKPSDLALNNQHISSYIRTNSSANLCEIGSTDLAGGGTGNDSQVIPRWSDGVNYSIMNATLVSGFSQARSDAFNCVNRIVSTEFVYFRNTTKTTQTKTSSSAPAYNYYIGARNNTNTAQYYSNRNIAFATIGDGLNDTDASNLYTAVNAFQTTLSRNV